MRSSAFRLLHLVVATTFFAAMANEARAWPDKPIRLLIGIAPGGTQDFIARAVKDPLAELLGQQIILESRPSAGGILAAGIVAKAAPDGYTLFHASSAFVITPSIQRQLPYDTFKDFAPITMLAASTGYMLVVNPAVKATTLSDFITLAKNTKNDVRFSSAGVGNNLHLIGELFNLRAGTHLRHIPYKGGNPAVFAVVSGEVESLFSTTTDLLVQQVKSGKVRPIAFSGSSRWSQLPDVPTMDEAGLSGFSYLGAWHGWFAPARTPPAVVQQLNTEIKKVLQIPSVKETLNKYGYPPVGNSPEEFRKVMQTEFVDFGKAIKAAGIEPE